MQKALRLLAEPPGSPRYVCVTPERIGALDLKPKLVKNLQSQAGSPRVSNEDPSGRLTRGG